MMAGHTLVKILSGFAWTMLSLGGVLSVASLPTLRGKRHLELAPVRKELLTGDGEQLQPSTNKMETVRYLTKSIKV